MAPSTKLKQPLQSGLPVKVMVWWGKYDSAAVFVQTKRFRADFPTERKNDDTADHDVVVQEESPTFTKPVQLDGRLLGNSQLFLVLQEIKALIDVRPPSDC